MPEGEKNWNPCKNVLVQGVEISIYSSTCPETSTGTDVQTFDEDCVLLVKM